MSTGTSDGDESANSKPELLTFTEKLRFKVRDPVEYSDSGVPLYSGRSGYTTRTFRGGPQMLWDDTATRAFLQQIRLHDELAALSLQCRDPGLLLPGIPRSSTYPVKAPGWYFSTRSMSREWQSHSCRGHCRRQKKWIILPQRLQPTSASFQGVAASRQTSSSRLKIRPVDQLSAFTACTVPAGDRLQTAPHINQKE
jgi:hypothetical protein